MVGCHGGWANPTWALYREPAPPGQLEPPRLLPGPLPEPSHVITRPVVTGALRPLGLMAFEVHGVMMFVDPGWLNPKTGVHIFFAKELVRPTMLDDRPSLW